MGSSHRSVTVTKWLSRFGHGIAESGGLSAFDISSKRDFLTSLYQTFCFSPPTLNSGFIQFKFDASF